MSAASSAPPRIAAAELSLADWDIDDLKALQQSAHRVFRRKQQEMSRSLVDRKRGRSQRAPAVAKVDSPARRDKRSKPAASPEAAAATAAAAPSSKHRYYSAGAGSAGQRAKPAAGQWTTAAYFNPTNMDMVWDGNGAKPEWVAQLEDRHGSLEAVRRYLAALRAVLS